MALNVFRLFWKQSSTRGRLVKHTGNHRICNKRLIHRIFNYKNRTPISSVLIKNRVSAWGAGEGIVTPRYYAHKLPLNRLVPPQLCRYVYLLRDNNTLPKAGPSDFLVAWIIHLRFCKTRVLLENARKSRLFRV